MIDWLRKRFSKSKKASETFKICKDKRFRYLDDGVTKVEVTDD